MKQRLLKKMTDLVKANSRLKKWQRASTAMAAVVVFVTTYMLILPAITLENNPVCGLEEHTHTESCYQLQLVCGQEELVVDNGDDPAVIVEPPAVDEPAGAETHVHTDSCYETVSALSCPQEECDSHTHSDPCYGIACGQDEQAGHAHSDSCYETVSDLTCAESESSGHSHSGSCYDAESGELTCSESESAGHSHSDSCYTEHTALVCTESEQHNHTHSDACTGLICGQSETEGHAHTHACYTEETNLTCGLSESKPVEAVDPEPVPQPDPGTGPVVEPEPAGHVHTDACYEKVLVCGHTEHIHHVDCYGETELTDENTACGIPAHEHGDACHDADGNLICGLENHTHTADCIAVVPSTQIPFPEELPEGYIAYEFEDENGLSVLAYAPQTAFDQDVTLTAAVLEEDGEEYLAAGANLDEQEIEYEGYVALDISFIDAEENEIEPDTTDGQVFVKIQAQALLPAGVTEDSVSVQHHAETIDSKFFGLIKDTTTTVEVVASSDVDMGEVTVQPNELDEAVADVESTFSVESFSSFTITWNNRWGTTEYGSVTVYHVDANGDRILDANGNDLPANPVDVTNNTDENNRRWVTLGNSKATIGGYTYEGAHIDSYNGTLATQIRFVKNYNNNEGTWRYRTGGSGDGTSWTTVPREVYLVYKETYPTIDTEDSRADGITLNLYNYTGGGNDKGINTGTPFDFGGSRAGGYNMNHWDGGDDLLSKHRIVRNKLAEVTIGGTVTKHPVLTYDGQSLSYLFPASTVTDKVTNVVNDANHLFYREDGSYYFNSKDHFASINQTTRDFTVYQAPKAIENAAAWFLPFNKVTDSSSADYLFGMTMEFDFYMPENGKYDTNGDGIDEDMIFRFGGDDDVWVFIDDVLVLDLGGIHGIVSGTINFRTGDIKYDQKTFQLSGATDFVKDKPDRPTTLEAAFKAAGLEWNGLADVKHNLKFYYLNVVRAHPTVRLSLTLSPSPARLSL